MRVELGGFGFERLHVAPAQFQCRAGLVDRCPCAAGVADSETRWGAVDRGGLGVGAHNANGRDQKRNLLDPSLSPLTSRTIDGIRPLTGAPADILSASGSLVTSGT